MSDEELDKFIDSLIDQGALDDADVLMKAVDGLSENDKLAVMDEIDAIREMLDDPDANAINTAIASGKISDDFDNAVDKLSKSTRGNPVTEKMEIDKDSDGDTDLTITKQDDNDDNKDDTEPTENTKDNASEQADMPNEQDIKDFADELGISTNKSKLNNNIVNAVSEHRF